MPRHTHPLTEFKRLRPLRRVHLAPVVHSLP
jgi:hypothetical protein